MRNHGAILVGLGYYVRVLSPSVKEIAVKEVQRRLPKAHPMARLTLVEGNETSGAFRLLDSLYLPAGSSETTADARSGSEDCRFHISIVFEPRRHVLVL